MSKFYLLPFLFLAAQASGQSPQNLIKVRQGQSFTIRAPYSLPPHRNTLKNVLRIAGAGAMAYGSEQMLSRQTGKGIVVTQERNSWLVPIGAAVTLTAGPIAGRKKDPGTFVTYSLYNKDKALLSRKVVLVTNKQLKKNGGIAVSDKAAEDGFLQVSVSDDKTYTDNADWDNGLVIALESDGEAEADDLAFSRVRASVEAVPTRRASIPAPGLAVSKALTITGSLPVAGRVINGSRSLAKPVVATKPAVAAGATPGVSTPRLLNVKSIPSAPAGKQRGGTLPEPFNLFPPAGRFSIRSGPADGDDDDETKDVDDWSSDDRSSDEGDPDISDFSSDTSSDPPGGSGSDPDGDPDAGDPDDPCTLTMINGGTPDDYQSCVCSLNPDASACAPIDPNATPTAAGKCNVCWVAFGSAVATATATYYGVTLPACSANNPTPAVLSACQSRAITSYGISLSAAVVTLGTCRYLAGCVI